MNFECIVYEKKEEVAIITLNRPQVLNAMNKRLWLDVEQAIADYIHDGFRRNVARAEYHGRHLPLAIPANVSNSHECLNAVHFRHPEIHKQNSMACFLKSFYRFKPVARNIHFYLRQTQTDDCREQSSDLSFVVSDKKPAKITL